MKKELLKLSPEAIPTEKVRSLTEDKIELKIVIDEELKNKLDQLKDLLSNSKPNMTYQELICYLTGMALKKLDPAQKIKSQVTPTQKNNGQVAPVQNKSRSQVRVNSTAPTQPNSQRNVSGAKKLATDVTPIFSTSALQTNSQTNRADKPTRHSRYISSAIKYAIWMRDRGQCTFTDKLTGRRCSSSKYLHYDHIKPFSLGGETSVSNLRLLCWQHNQLRAEKTFWKW